MLHRLILLIRRLLEYKPVRFILVGGVNTVFGYGVFAGIYLLTHHRLRALVAATVLGVTFNYFTTGRLVFANKGAKAMVPFVLVYAVLLLVNAPLLEGLVRLGLPTLIAQAIAIPFLAGLSYLINHYWVFRQPGQTGALDAAMRAAIGVDGKASPWLWPAAAAGGLLLTVLIMKGRIYAASTDLAQHYELAHAIATTWAWPAGTPLSSGIQAYPPLSHYLGALAGVAFGSTLVGMNAVVTAAIFACYLLLARPLTVGGPVSALAAVVIAGAGLWLARTQHAAEGFEVYGNFFYAQLVGEAVFLAAALWMANARTAWPVRWAVAAGLTFVCGWLYLIASVEIALAYLALEAMLLVRRMAAERRLRLPWTAPLLVGAATLPLLIYLHPYFRRMVEVSNNNGGLDLQGLETLVPELAALLLVVGLVLGLSPVKAERWRRPLLFLAVACCATASAALAQTLILDVAKIGSPYAVKKYGFSVVTLLVFGVGALAGHGVDAWRPRRPWRLLAIGAPCLIALVVTVALPLSRPDDLDRFVAYEKGAQSLLRDPRAPRDAFGNTASLNDDFDRALNLALSMVDLGLGQPKSLAAYGIMGSPPPQTYVLVKASAGQASGNCDITVPAVPTLALERLHCGALSDGQTLFSEDLSKSPTLSHAFVSGWSAKEPTGVWSDGPAARIALHFDRVTGPLLLSVSGSAFIPSDGYVQHVQVSAGDTPVADWRFDGGAPTGIRKAVIPASLIVNGDLDLRFAFPDAIRPDSPGAARRLGLFVTSLSVDTMGSMRPGDRIDLRKLIAIPPFFRSGWSEKEPTGVWSSGHRSSLLLPIAPGDADPVLVLEGYGFFPKPGYRQRVTVSSGSATLAEWTLDAAAPPRPRSIVVPRRLVVGGELALDFDFPDATSPAVNKVSADRRELAFFLTAVGLKDPARQP